MNRPKRNMSWRAVYNRMKNRWDRTKEKHFAHRKTTKEGRGRRK